MLAGRIRPSMSATLDCVVVGYNDVDIDALARRLKPTRERSGALRNFETNTVPVDGKRIPYMALLNRAITDATGTDPRLHVGELPNLAVTYLTSYLRRRGFATEHVNFFNYEKDRLAQILADKPRVVAITTTFYVENGPISELVKYVRERSPTTKIAVGGPHIYNLCTHYDTLTQGLLFKEIGADIYIHESQGELTLSRVLAALRPGGAGLASVPNLVYFDEKKKLQRTPKEPEANDLDENVVDWTSFDPSYYAPTAQMRTARSCAFKCSFCRYPVMAGALTLTSIDVVEKEMRYLAEHGVKNLVFIDDTFNVPLPRFKELCRMMIRNRFSFDWFSYFRCGNADDAAFDLMAEAGCKGVFLGIESGDNGVLKNMNKFAKIERYAHGIGKLNERKIQSFASLIVGFPGETEATVQNTIDFVQASSPTYYRAELYFHDANAPIQERAQEFGIQSQGYAWKHATMDWKQGTAAVDRMYRTITSSTILPLYMFDFWSLPYLVGKGISLDKVKAFTEKAQPLLLRGLEDEGADTSAQRRELAALFA